MKIVLSIILTLGLTVGFGQKSETLSLKEIEGLWYVNMSNFPMWLKGDKTNPRFTYTSVSSTRVEDDVSFQKNGKTKHIKGYDTVNPEEKMAFIWRGKGLLFMSRSKWKIVYYNKRFDIALLAFEKTLFTPAGFDVISRQKKLPANALKLIRQEFAKLAPDSNMVVIQQV